MHDYRNGIGYMTMLKHRRVEMQRQIDATPKPLSLHERITTWYNGLSEQDQKRAWRMRDLKTIFHATPQAVAQCLWALGWTRRRSWADSKPTARFWLRE